MFQISSIIDKINASCEEYLIEVLKKYTLLSSDFTACDAIKSKYPNLDISYSPVLSKDYKLYVIYKNNLQPIMIEYSSPEISYDNINMNVNASCRCWVRTMDGVIL